MNFILYLVIIYVYGSVAEWVAHKYFMHRVTWFKGIYDDHHLHHKNYPANHFISPKEIKNKFSNLVLCFEHLMIFILPAATISLYIDFTLSAMFMLFGIVHFYYYNSIHSAMHLNQKIKFLPQWFVKLVSWTHFMHHNHPSSFYCVSMPLADHLFGTVCKMTDKDREAWKLYCSTETKDSFDEDYKEIRKLDDCVLSGESFKEGRIPKIVNLKFGDFITDLMLWLQVGEIHIDGRIGSGTRLIVCNHGSWLDIFILNRLSKVFYTPLKIMAAQSVLQFNPILGFILTRFLPCYAAATSLAVDTTVKILNDGYTAAICAEGWAFLSEQPIHPFKTGAVRIAQQANIDITPISIKYTKRPGKWIESLPFPLQCLISFLFLMNKGDIYIKIGQKFEINGDIKQKTVDLHDEIQRIYDGQITRSS